MELSWFRKPAEGRSGTLNVCYNALDRHVINGAAESPALVEPPVDYATLLERVSALAGSIRGFGVGAGEPVAASVDEGYDELLVLLACLRLGAVLGEDDTRLLVKAEDLPLLLKVGRDDPAPCAELDPEAPAYVVGGETVAARDAVGHDSPRGRWLAALAAGEAVSL